MPGLIDLTGVRFGRLVIAGRAPNAMTLSGQQRTRWDAVCDCGTQTMVRGSQLSTGRVRSCGCLQREARAATGRRNRRAVVGYERAHSRLEKSRGSAGSMACSDCEGRAHEWSYNVHCDYELTGRNGSPYCLHLDHYTPRCRSCHIRHDRSRDALGRFAGRPAAESKKLVAA